MFEIISVVIPVFNAEKFILKAIDSALIQKEVKEIIVVDDGSKDKSLCICLEKSNKEEKVKVFFHENNNNLGRAITRNVGIKNSSSKYIAFLDADDFYLPNRFKNDIKLLESNGVIDGVYNAIGSHFYREKKFFEGEKLKITTTSEFIPPDELFEKIGPIGHYGYFSGIGLTLKKDIFSRSGLFNENLEVAEDTELWLRMTLVAKLIPGIITKPVALRGVHEDNTSFVDKNLYKKNNLKMYVFLLNWMFEKNIVFRRKEIIWKKIWIQNLINNSSFKFRMKYWLTTIFKYPVLLKSIYTYKNFPILRLIKTK